MRRRFCDPSSRLPLLGLAVTLISCGVGKGDTQESQRTPQVASEIVNQSASADSQSRAGDLVRQSITNKAPEFLYTKVGPAGDGIGVVVNDVAGYWVKDGVAFAANALAKTWSPDLDYAPPSTSYGAIRFALGIHDTETSVPKRDAAASVRAPSERASRAKEVSREEHVEVVNGWNISVLGYMSEERRRAAFFDLLRMQDSGADGAEGYVVVAERQGISVGELRAIVFEGSAKKWIYDD